MNILILGAGQVGTTAAYSLAREESNEVTIVDRDPKVLRGFARPSRRQNRGGACGFSGRVGAGGR